MFLSKLCHELGVLDIGAYQIVGRRDADIVSTYQRVTTCNKCCSKNLCNSDNCTSLSHISIITSSTTSAITTEASTGLAR
ncbi:hypothetical protein CHS0354_042424, partial [Potamilus streckersoni]